jgi:CRP-like cAMP-binding protein
MAYLLSEAAIQGTDSFTIPYDRQELADFLGVERSAMSAVISKLRDDGYIKVNRRQFQLIR